MTKKKHYLEYKLLVAMPHLQDDLFSKSVLYICEHDQHGAMAFIINKPLPISMGDVLRQLNMSPPSSKANELFLLQGGPIAREQLYIMQVLPNRPNLCTLVQPQDLLQSFANGEQLTNILPFLGYTKWEAGQLEKELIGNHWLICNTTTNVLTKVPLDERWEYCLNLIGIKSHHLSIHVGHA